MTEFSKRSKADLWLLAMTLVWGSTFPTIKVSLEFISPLLLVGLRFGLATLAMGLLFHRQLKSIPRSTLRDGSMLGVLMGTAYVAQTLGLSGTSASRAGFLTALYVAFTPPLQMVFSRSRPTLYSVAGAVLSLMGLVFLSTPTSHSPLWLAETLRSGLNVGDLWTLLCALLFAFHIIALDHLAPKHEPLRLCFLQLLIVGVGAIVCSPLLETVTLNWDARLALALPYLAFFGSLGAVLVQTRFQHETTPTRAAVIFTMEAVFAAILSVLFLGDVLNSNELIGGGLIVGGLLASHLPTKDQVFASGSNS